MNLGFVRHQPQKHAREPDRLLRQIPATLVGAHHIVPADAEGGVNRLQHGVKTLRQITLLRYLELEYHRCGFSSSRGTGAAPWSSVE